MMVELMGCVILRFLSVAGVASVSMSGWHIR